jgi:hypothetical protein
MDPLLDQILHHVFAALGRAQWWLGQVPGFSGLDWEAESYAQLLAGRIRWLMFDCSLTICHGRHCLPDPQHAPESDEFRHHVWTAILGPHHEKFQVNRFSQGMLFRLILTDEQDMHIGDVERLECPCSDNAHEGGTVQCVSRMALPERWSGQSAREITADRAGGACSGRNSGGVDGRVWPP